MNLPDIFSTTAVRLALRYLTVYAVVLAVALGAFVLITGHFVNRQIEQELQADFAMITAAYDQQGVAGAGSEIDRLGAEKDSEQYFYLLVSAQGEKIAGNLIDWPEVC